ncbi:thioesterase family protein [Pseudonocardia ailaonensis]|uniref:Thioesterase family protein n=1 Tax=Pseudonocardia ailaonensis TaxID=367279 RepID=A0ABN2NPS4_9PSEU
MPPFVAHVPMRWTDQDAYRHLNHAMAVTLLEEARVAMVFTAAAEADVRSFAGGLLVAGLSVEYRGQVRYRPEPLRVAMEVRGVRAASFMIDYAMHSGPDESDTIAVAAQTRMAVFDLESQRPRRLTVDERTWLQRWTTS